MDFSVSLMRHERCTLVRVQGEIDVVSRACFEQAMLDALDDGGPMIVDMRGVTFCDSTGLNAILAAYRRGAAQGTQVALIALPPRVRRVFKITAVDRFIPIHDTLREALGELRSSPRTAERSS